MEETATSETIGDDLICSSSRPGLRWGEITRGANAGGIWRSSFPFQRRPRPPGTSSAAGLGRTLSPVSRKLNMKEGSERRGERVWLAVGAVNDVFKLNAAQR